MKFFLAIIFLPLISFSQFITCKVADLNTKQPLYYATICYGNPKKITFSDSLGNFFLQATILNSIDSVQLAFIGFETISVSKQQCIEGNIFYLKRKTGELQEVLIKNCILYQNKEIDYRYEKIGSYWTCSPDYRGEFIGYYPNNASETGYIKEIELFAPSFPLIRQTFSIPLRLHWYEWDSVTQMPSKELTDTSILLYAHKHGRNKIALPEKHIYFSETGIVLGLEFLFPPAMEKEYLQLDPVKARDWINKNTWSFGMAEDHAGYMTYSKSHLKSNSLIRLNLVSSNKLPLKPALNLLISVCK